MSKRQIIAGIYSILHRDSGKIYIGQAVDIGRRWWGHSTELRHNKHNNKHLQSCWNKYGESAFDFKIIFRLFVDDMTDHEIATSLTALEQQIVDREVARRGRRQVFNQLIICVTSPAGTKLTKEHKSRIKEGVNKPEVKEKIKSGAARRWSDEAYKEKMRDVSRRTMADEEHCRRQAVRYWPEGAVNILWEHEGSNQRFVHWNTTKSSRILGISRPLVSLVLRGKGRAKRAGGWTVRYVYEGEDLTGIPTEPPAIPPPHIKYKKGVQYVSND